MVPKSAVSKDGLPNDKAWNTLVEAKQLAAQGKFQEALEKHIWFHDHALEVNPAYYGVRLSFALSDWVDLGNKYPKALDALKEIRDKKTARLLAGEQNHALFHDVAAINEHVGQSEATMVLFKHIAAAHPEFAALTYSIVDKALIQAGEYDLAKKCLGDPMTRFAEIKTIYDNRIKFARTSPYAEESRQSADSIFSNQVVGLITVLNKTGDPVLARQIQSQTLVILDNPEIRMALNQ